jgi:hypothetical protein
MTTRKASPLPDITDADFRRRLDPLAQAVVPGAASQQPAEPATGSGSHSPAEPLEPTEAIQPTARGGEGRGGYSPEDPDYRSTDNPTAYAAGISRLAASPNQIDPSPLAERIAAVTHMEAVRAARGPKKGVEFLLPARVVSALKMAAAREGTSMTVKVLEALRAAGYPITDADFVDLRKLPKR